MTKNIVVIGAGFGGLRTALGLAKKFKDSSDYKIILIDKNSYQTYTPSLYEVATGYRGEGMSSEALHQTVRGEAQERDFEENLAGSSCFVIRDVIDGLPITFIKDEVVDINVETKSVVVRSGDAIIFEYCVIALGSEATFFGVEGAHTCCNALKTIKDALLIRATIESIIKKIANNNKDANLVVIGAGLSGFEVATEMAKYVKHLSKDYGVGNQRIKIVLIEAGDKILSSAPPSMRSLANKRLGDLGIELIIKARIVKTEPNKVIFEDGRELAADIILWGGGIKGPSLLKRVAGLQLNKSGKVIVDKYLRAKGYKDIFAIGDSASFYDEATAREAPANAWVAEYEADSVIRNIYAGTKGIELKEYKMKFPGLVSSAGGKYAIAHLRGITFSGFFAWVLKRIIDLKYILSLYPFFKAFKIWLSAVILFTRND